MQNAYKLPRAFINYEYCNVPDEFVREIAEANSPGEKYREQLRAKEEYFCEREEDEKKEVTVKPENEKECFYVERERPLPELIINTDAKERSSTSTYKSKML